MKGAGHLLIEEVNLSPRQEWSDGAKAWRFVRVSSGTGYWLDIARPRIFSEGEMVVVAPLVKAVIRASQLNEVVLHGFQFAPDLLCGFFTMTELHFFDNGGPKTTGPVQFLPSTHPATQRLAALIGRREPGPELSDRAELLSLAVGFLSHGLGSLTPAATQDPSVHGRFQQIIGQMPDIEMIHHTPEQLAALCGCSPRHFNRLFRQHFGEAPRARQTELRLRKARQLLGATDEKITQIALDSGYRSLSLFNSLFKRRFGLSPSEWRQQSSRADGSTFRP